MVGLTDYEIKLNPFSIYHQNGDRESVYGAQELDEMKPESILGMGRKTIFSL